MSGPTFVLSEFQKDRQRYTPPIPKCLLQSNISFALKDLPVKEAIKELFPTTHTVQYAEFLDGAGDQAAAAEPSPLRIGVVLSGGQASGGHNVIAGIYDNVKKYHSGSQLFGFRGGPGGIFNNKYVEIDDALMDMYRNQGGFDMICSGRDKITTPKQFEDSMNNCKNLNLDGLVVIGGDDSNTNAALLAEYFKKNEAGITVVGCPKTIDGDLMNEFIETSFGFDTAVKTYSELIGNLCNDALSTKKQYHFVRLMGRSASHITLECELQTHATWAWIGEEVQQKGMSVEALTNKLADIIMERANRGKNYGVILVPEGLIEFIPEFTKLIGEMNEIMSKAEPSNVAQQLEESFSPESLKLFKYLPNLIRDQLMLDRDPHGNVQVARIDTERLLILLLETELANRNYPFKFLPESHYFGYEGRSCLPSNFDATYCYGLGQVAGVLVRNKMTGCMATLADLTKPFSEWRPAGVPLVSMMDIERRHGANVPVITKALTELDSPCFLAYEKVRDHWAVNDCFRSPGSIQFAGVGEARTTYLVSPPTAEDLASPADDACLKGTYANKHEHHLSELQKSRTEAEVAIPAIFSNGLSGVNVEFGDRIEPASAEAREKTKNRLPTTWNSKSATKFVEIVQGNSSATALNIGVLFLGRQAPGGHNVIDGLLTAVASLEGSKIIGFKDGSAGLIKNDFLEITPEVFKYFRNQGGFDLLGRSIDSVRTAEELEATKSACATHNLHGLVLIGATHTLTDAAYLTEYFLANEVKTCVVGIPASIDGNIAHPMFETCVGFDTASRLYAQMIGNIMTDAASSTKYWYFIRLMGRDPSHLVLEAGLQTHPNILLIGEENKAAGESMQDIVRQIADVVVTRQLEGKNFGTVLIPEGLLSHLSHYKELIRETNVLLNGKTTEEQGAIISRLLNEEGAADEYFTPISAPIFKTFPEFIRKQMLTKRAVSGGVQVSNIETERLLGEAVSAELSERKKAGTYGGSFAFIPNFFGYQGRSSMPTLFDCSLGTTYGLIAAAVVSQGLTGYCTTARGLTGSPSKWAVGAIPLIGMLKLTGYSLIYGENKPQVKSAEVDINSGAFRAAREASHAWLLGDHYTNPGPIQYNTEASTIVNATLQHNHQNYVALLDQISTMCQNIQSECRFGVREDLLKTAVIGLSSVEGILKLHKESNNQDYFHSKSSYGKRQMRSDSPPTKKRSNR